MEQENKLERKIKNFDWKEWTPFIGLYFVPRNILTANKSHLLENEYIESFNGIYHGLVSVCPIIYLISQIIRK